MTILFRAACLLILSLFAWGFSAEDSRADVACTVSQGETPYYLDADEDLCRTSGDYPENGAMVRTDLGADYVIIDVSYAAGAGEREPSDLHCTSGTCGVGEMDDTGDTGDLGLMMACEGDCTGAFSYDDAWGNRKNVALDYSESQSQVVATLTGNHGPQGAGVMTVNVPASLPVQNGIFTLEYEFSELATREDGSGTQLPLEIVGGVLDSTSVLGTVWTARIVPSGEGTVDIKLPEGSMEGLLTGNPLNADYLTSVPVDLTPPEVTLSYIGAGAGGVLSEVFQFVSDDPTALPTGDLSVTVSGVSATMQMSGEDDDRFTVTADEAGTATLVLEAGAFVDAAGNLSQPSAPLEHEFGERIVDVAELAAIPGWDVDVGEQMTITATLDPAIDEGQIFFLVDGVRASFSVPQNGAASFVPGYLEAGAHEVVAYYAPPSDRYVAGAQQVATIEVSRADVSISLDAISGARTLGDEIVLTGQAPDFYTGTMTLQSSVDGGPFSAEAAYIFRDANTFEVTVQPATAGSWSYRVIAEETGDYAGATSNTAQVEVVDYSAGGQLGVDRVEFEIGERPQLTAVMEDAAMSGDVVFYQDGTEIGRDTLIDGEAGLLAPVLEAGGTVAYSAEFLGNSPWEDAGLGQVEIQVARRTTSIALATDAASYTAGEHAILTATLSDLEASGNIAFVQDDNLFVTVPVQNGRAEVPSAPFEAFGSVVFEALYEGDAVFSPSQSEVVSVSVERITTQLGLAATPSKVQVGEPVELVADISPSSAEGDVVFYADGERLDTISLSGGIASVSYAPQDIGEHVVHAQFLGDATYDADQSGDVLIEAEAIEPTGSFASDLARYVLGDTVEVSVTFSQADVSGAVEFTAAGEVVATAPLWNGAATASFEPEVAGSLRLGATYLGDHRYASRSFPAVDITVERRETAGAVQIDSDNYTVGQTAFVSASVSPATATGRVEFFVNGDAVGTAPLSGGFAELTLPEWQSAGMKLISARYLGDSNHDASNLTAAEASVARASAFISLDVESSVYDVGDRPSLNIDITPAPAGGEIIVRLDGVEVGRVSAAGGSATYKAPALERAGTLSYSAEFTGDEGIDPATSSASSITVRALEISLELTIDGTTAGAAAKVDEVVGVQATLSEAAPGGLVRLIQDGALIATLDASEGMRVFDFEADTSSAGLKTLFARFDGDDRYVPAESAQRTLDVSRYTTATALRVSNAAPQVGEQISLTAEVTPDAAGMVVFTDGSSTLATAAVISGEARTTLVAEARDYALSAEFMPQESRVYTSSQSEVVSLETGKIPTTIELNGSAAEVEPGDIFIISGSVTDTGFDGDVRLMRRAEGEAFTAVETQSVRDGTFLFSRSEPISGDVSFRVEMVENAAYAAPASEIFEATVVLISGEGQLSSNPSQTQVDTEILAQFAADDQDATGMVEFFFDGQSMGVVELEQGIATQVIATPNAGTFSLVARYLGSSTHGAFTTPERLVVVDRLELELLIAADAAQLEVGEQTSFMVTADTSDASGLVELRRDGVVVETGEMLGGQVEITHQMLAEGTYQFDARFTGSERFNVASSSNSVQIDVARANASGGLRASETSIRVGQSVDLWVEMTPQAASGTVRFYADEAFIGEGEITNGVAMIGFAPSSAGEIVISAEYMGSPEFDPFAVSGSVALEVSRLSATATITANKSEYAVGESARLTVTLSHPEATGMVEVFQNGTSLGMAPLSSGEVSLFAQITSPGETIFTGQYLGDTQFAPFEINDPLRVTGTAEASSVSLDPLPATIRAGESVELSGDLVISQFNADFNGVVAIDMRMAQQGPWEEVVSTTATTGSWSGAYTPSIEGEASFRARISDPAQTSGFSVSQVRDITLTRSDVSLSLAASVAQAAVGQEVSLEVLASPADTNGEVRIEIDGTTLGSAPLQSGTAHFDTSFSAEGRYEIVAIFDGTAGFRQATSLPAVVDVGRTHTELTLEADQTDVYVDEEIVLTAHLTPSLEGAEIALEQNGETRETAVVSDGAAHFTVPMQVAGAASFRAVFAGTKTHIGATSTPVAVSVSRLTAQIDIFASTDRAALDEGFSISVQAMPADVDGPLRLVRNGQTVTTLDMVDGQAVFDTSLAEEGRYEFLVAFEGSARFEPATSDVAVVDAGRIHTEMTLDVDEAALVVDDNAVLTAHLTPEIDGALVHLERDGEQISSATTEDGVAEFNVPMEASGNTSFRAVFDGTQTHRGVSSADVLVQVAALPASLEMRASAQRADLDDVFTITVEASPVELEGQILIEQNGVLITTLDMVGGQAVFETSLSEEGRHEFQATFEGSSRFAAAASNITTVDAGRIFTELSLEAASPEVFVGDSALFSATLSPALDGVQVEILRDGVVIAEETSENGEISFSVLMPQAEEAMFEAIFAGTQTHADARSLPVPVLAARRPVEISLSANAETVAVGEEVFLSVIADPASAAGPLRIERNGETIATLDMSGGAAVFETSLASEGRYVFSAQFEGTEYLAAATSNQVTVDAGRAYSALSLKAELESVRIGDMISLTALLDPATPGADIVLEANGAYVASAQAVAGTATFEVLAETEGQMVFEASFAGSESHAGANSNAIPVQISPREVSGQLISDTQTYAVGGIAHFEVHLDQPQATGQIVFTSAGSVLGQVDLMDGIAALEVVMAQEGLVPVSASYAGDGTYESWSTQAPLHVAVGRDLRRLTLEASTTAPGLGGEVAFSGALSGEPVSGSVEIMEQIEGAWVGIATLELEANAFTQSLPFETEGLRRFRAELVPHAEVAAPPSDVIEIEVVRRTVRASLTSDASIYDLGEEVLLTFTLDDQEATGDVSFALSDGSPLAEETVSEGQAAAGFTPSAPGNYEVVAQYSGNAWIAPSEATVVISVGVVATTGSLSADKDAYEVGDVAQISVDIAPMAATGIVALLEAGQEIDRASLADGVAEFALPLEAAGRRALVARYAGDATYAAWQSPEPLVLEVGLEEVRLSLEALTSEARAGEPVRFRLSVLPDRSQGEVVLRLITEDQDGAAATRSASPAATETRIVTLDGRESYDIEAVMPRSGDLAVEASYAGSGTYASATSSVVIEPSAPAQSTVQLSISENLPKAGDTITLRADVAPNEATGEVSFLVDGVAVARAAIENGAASADWEISSGQHRLQASYAGDTAYSATVSNEVLIDVRPRALDLFDERREFIEGVMDDELDRASDARARATDRHMSGVRDRLRDEDYRQLPRSEDLIDPHGTWEGSVWQPFEYHGQGRAHATNGAFDANGTFSARRRIGGTDLSQFVSGAFEASSRSDYGASVEGSLSTSVEKRVSENVIVGATVGVEGAETAISGEMDGTMRTIGVNAGVYGAKRLAGDVVVDGFANVARLNHQLDLEDDDLETDATYGSTAVQVGGTVSGRYKMGRTEFLPAVTLRHTMAVRDRASFSARADGEEAEAVIEGRTTHKTRVEVTPEVRISSREEGGVVTTLKPKVVCEASSGNTECGAGIGAGVEVPVADGRGKIKAEASVENVGGETRKVFFLGFEIVF